MVFSIKCDSVCRDQLIGHDHWDKQWKYHWTNDDLPAIRLALCDATSKSLHVKVTDALADHKCTNAVAKAFNLYIEQACQRACQISQPIHRTRKKRGPAWYDKDCRIKRSRAIKTGERVVTQEQKLKHESCCKEYRACKQRKKRAFKNSSVDQIENAFLNNKWEMWHEFNRICNYQMTTNSPEPDEFFDYFSKTAKGLVKTFFNTDYEWNVKAFLDKYDKGEITVNNTLEMDILNANFTIQEVKGAIDYLRNNKAPGCDNIPAEFIKYCKELVAEDLTTVLNYIIELRDFPEIWAEGLRSVIFKSGQRNVVKNYRGGITILAIFAKIFELLVHNRLTFLNEAFCKIDEFNGGFLRGSRTADDLFILLGLIQKQITMGKQLYIYMLCRFFYGFRFS